MTPPHFTPSARYAAAARRISAAWQRGQRIYWWTAGAALERVTATAYDEDGYLQIGRRRRVAVQHVALCERSGRIAFSRPKERRRA